VSGLIIESATLSHLSVHPTTGHALLTGVIPRVPSGGSRTLPCALSFTGSTAPRTVLQHTFEVHVTCGEPVQWCVAISRAAAAGAAANERPPEVVSGRAFGSALQVWAEDDNGQRCPISTVIARLHERGAELQIVFPDVLERLGGA
jgi:hypothetical protein